MDNEVKKAIVKSRIRDFMPLMGFFGIVIIFSILTGGKIVQPRNLGLMLSQVFVLMIAATGVFFIMTVGGLDFSQGDDLHTVAWLSARRHPSGRGTQFHADYDAWIKEDTLERSAVRPLYETWIEQGWLHVSEGMVFQPSLFINRLDELIKKGVQFMYFGYDKYQSKDPINTLKAYLQSVLNIPNPEPYVQVVSQLNSEFNGPTDDLYSAMFAPIPFISFSPSPLWPWCFGNCALEIDNRENKRPVKAAQSDSCKIDPVQALIDAMILYQRYEGTQH